MKARYRELGQSLAAPLLWCYFEQLKQFARDRGVKRLLFMGGEGLLLSRLYHLRFPEADIQFMPISSRVLWAAARKDRATIEAICKGEPFKGSLLELLEQRFGGGRAEAEAIGSPELEVKLPHDSEKVAELLVKQLTELNRHAKEQSELLDKYAGQATDQCIVAGYGVDAVGQSVLHDLGFSERLFLTGIFPMPEGSDWLRTPLMLREACTRKLARTDGQVVAVAPLEGPENVESEQVQQGIHDYFGAIMKLPESNLCGDSPEVLFQAMAESGIFASEIEFFKNVGKKKPARVKR